MFELIGGLLYLIFKGIVWLGKILIKLFICTLPIDFCIFAFFMGGTVANAIWGEKYSMTTLEESYEIHVTVHWENGESDSYLTVRRDLQWTTSDGKVGEDLFLTNGGWEAYDNVPRVPTKNGYRFLGLYTSPAGGSMVVSPGGYCVTNLHSDIELYALWEPIGTSEAPTSVTDGADALVPNIFRMHDGLPACVCA